MATFFLLIIYLAFISLGLPDSLLGAAWPVMQPDLGAPLETAGMLFMVVAGGTIVSSLASGAVIKRFGTGKVALVSCAMTAGALLGFSFAPSVSWLVVCAVPLGLGAGSVDAGLNNYVAAHYKAHHMSWLHCFWGVGATIGPIIMAGAMSRGSWSDGYLTVAAIQFALVLVLFATLPLWERAADKAKTDSEAKRGDDSDVTNPGSAEPYAKPPRRKGVPFALGAFLFYCGLEAAAGLWGSSYLVEAKNLPASTAAQWVSLYYAGITVGRFATGFVTFKLGNKLLIRGGQAIALAGTALLLLPLPSGAALAGLILLGLGLAPIFPCMLHETPARFGKAQSQKIMGFQMAAAYTGSTFLPPLFGLLASSAGVGVLPLCLFAFAAAMLLLTERLNAIDRPVVFKRKHAAALDGVPPNK
ncbi:MFS transporter [Paenibacillaceae bacterium WGS1546]|uniref:MFS transporter n=1 Tax=Cohnella sp. WGS1546 TaxID=3366810 RepID=UPI00372D109E